MYDLIGIFTNARCACYHLRGGQQGLEVLDVPLPDTIDLITYFLILIASSANPFRW